MAFFEFQLYSGQLWQDLSISLSRVLIAFAIAAIFAFFLVLSWHCRYEQTKFST